MNLDLMAKIECKEDCKFMIVNTGSEPLNVKDLFGVEKKLPPGETLEFCKFTGWSE